MRSCGECSACCTVLAVNALGKPAGTDCPHDCGGCAIYESRPDGCRSYRCSWLEGDFSHDDRPDGIGLIVDKGMGDAFPGMWGKSARVARELWPGGGSDVVAALVTEGRSVMLRTHAGEADLISNNQLERELFKKMCRVVQER